MVLPKVRGVLASSELTLGPSGLMIPASNLGLDLLAICCSFWGATDNKESISGATWSPGVTRVYTSGEKQAGLFPELSKNSQVFLKLFFI